MPRFSAGEIFPKRLNRHRVRAAADDDVGGGVTARTRRRSLVLVADPPGNANKNTSRDAKTRREGYTSPALGG